VARTPLTRISSGITGFNNFSKGDVVRPRQQTFYAPIATMAEVSRMAVYQERERTRVTSVE